MSLGYFMVLLDTTILSVALPAIRSDLGGGLTGLQWGVNAYTIVFAGLLLGMGAFADRLGARRVYAAGLVIFVAASALSAAAPSLGALIACRAVLGLGGAALLPASLALLAHAYPEPASRTRALGIWASVTGMAMVAGPIVGGALVDSLSWRSIFLLNVPLGLVSLAAAYLFVSETQRQKQRGIDPAGLLLAFASIASLSYALMKSGAYGWSSARIVLALAVFACSAALFGFAEKKGKQPMLPLSLFKHPTVSAGMLSGMAINAGLSGILFLLPLYFQQSRGWSAHASGLALLPLTLPMTFGPIMTARIAARTGPRAPLTAGFALAAAGALLQAWSNADSAYAMNLIGLLLIGFGIPFIIPPLTAAIMSAAPRTLSGTASGALNSSRQLGGTVGVGLLGAIVSGSGSFLSGLHLALAFTAALLVCGGIVSFVWIGRSR
ncbi:MFS transporter [Cohnella lubricantis]|uniref:MFS transporter n=1 Tax=Cohnella lubricantis TaxID=2163172 RepID=UPI0021AB0DD0|nr:MFS transporter [Cohnella lubricantis]